MNTRMKALQLGLIALLVASTGFSISACSDQTSSKKTAQHTLIVEPKIAETHLYYNSVIAPLHMTSITSPADGIVAKIYFAYGATVTKNQILMELNSQKLEQDYQSDLTAYLQAKEKNATALQDYKTNQEMWKLQIIARNTLIQSQQAAQDAELGLLQARYKLQKDVNALGINQDITKLDLSNIDDIRKAMFNEKFNHVLLHAPANGLVLIPPKSSSSGSDSNSTTAALHEGDPVKEAQILLAIANMSGLLATVSVSEIDIDQIKVGQEATITGVGFPGITLKGSVTAVGSQAVAGDGGDSSIAKFPIEITIPSLTLDQQKIIHVGMSAQVALTIKQPPAILIPLTAVQTTHNQTTVQVLDPATKKVHQVPVKTGSTTADSVIITEGLKAGDEIILP